MKDNDPVTEQEVREHKRKLWLTYLIWCGPVAVLLACLFAKPSVEPESQAPTPRSESTIQVFFSPDGNCTQQIVDDIRGANEEILVQAFSFTSREIADALIAAHEQERPKINVRIILDAGQRRARGSMGSACAKAGIEVVYDAKHRIAHNKIIIIDRSLLFSGSFNFTESAQKHNAENLLRIRNPRLIDHYLANWHLHYGHSEP